MKFAYSVWGGFPRSENILLVHGLERKMHRKIYVLVSVDQSRLLQSQCHVGNVSASCGGTDTDGGWDSVTVTVTSDCNTDISKLELHTALTLVWI